MTPDFLVAAVSARIEKIGSVGNQLQRLEDA